jgi:hypothetical protein
VPTESFVKPLKLTYIRTSGRKEVIILAPLGRPSSIFWKEKKKNQTLCLRFVQPIGSTSLSGTSLPPL